MPRTIAAIRRMAKVKKRLRMKPHERVAQSCGKWRRSYLVAIRMLMAREDATFEFELDRVIGVGLRTYCPDLLGPAIAAIARDDPDAVSEEVLAYSGELVEARPPSRRMREVAEPSDAPPPPIVTQEVHDAAAAEMDRLTALVMTSPNKPSAIQLPKRAQAASRAVAPERPSAIERPGRVAPVEPAPMVAEPMIFAAPDTSQPPLEIDIPEPPIQHRPQTSQVVYEVCPNCKQEKPASVMPVHRQNCDAARSGLR